MTSRYAVSEEIREKVESTLPAGKHVEFVHGDITDHRCYKGRGFTHIFAFDAAFNVETREGVAVVLRRNRTWRVFVSCRKDWEQRGLPGLRCVARSSLVMCVSGESHLAYVYVRDRPAAGGAAAALTVEAAPAPAVAAQAAAAPPAAAQAAAAPPAAAASPPLDALAKPRSRGNRELVGLVLDAGISGGSLAAASQLPVGGMPLTTRRGSLAAAALPEIGAPALAPPAASPAPAAAAPVAPAPAVPPGAASQLQQGTQSAARPKVSLRALTQLGSTLRNVDSAVDPALLSATKSRALRSRAEDSLPVPAEHESAAAAPKASSAHAASRQPRSSSASGHLPTPLHAGGRYSAEARPPHIAPEDWHLMHWRARKKALDELACSDTDNGDEEGSDESEADAFVSAALPQRRTASSANSAAASATTTSEKQAAPSATAPSPARPLSVSARPPHIPEKAWRGLHWTARRKALSARPAADDDDDDGDGSDAVMAGRAGLATSASANVSAPKRSSSVVAATQQLGPTTSAASVPAPRSAPLFGPWTPRPYSDDVCPPHIALEQWRLMHWTVRRKALAASASAPAGPASVAAGAPAVDDVASSMADGASSSLSSSGSGAAPLPIVPGHASVSSPLLGSGQVRSLSAADCPPHIEPAAWRKMHWTARRKAQGQPSLATSDVDMGDDDHAASIGAPGTAPAAASPLSPPLATSHGGAAVAAQIAPPEPAVASGAPLRPFSAEACPPHIPPEQWRKMHWTVRRKAWAAAPVPRDESQSSAGDGNSSLGKPAVTAAPAPADAPAAPSPAAHVPATAPLAQLASAAIGNAAVLPRLGSGTAGRYSAEARPPHIAPEQWQLMHWRARKKALEDALLHASGGGDSDDDVHPQVSEAAGAATAHSSQHDALEGAEPPAASSAGSALQTQRLIASSLALPALAPSRPLAVSACPPHIPPDQWKAMHWTARRRTLDELVAGRDGYGLGSHGAGKISASVPGKRKREPGGPSGAAFEDIDAEGEEEASVAAPSRRLGSARRLVLSAVLSESGSAQGRDLDAEFTAASAAADAAAAQGSVSADAFPLLPPAPASCVGSSLGSLLRLKPGPVIRGVQTTLDV